MKPLTLQEAKDQMANEEGHKNYDYFYRSASKEDVNGLLQGVCRLYGDSQWNAALEKAIELSQSEYGNGLINLLEELKRLKR